MATSIWKKIGDVTGVNTLADSWKSLFKGDFRGFSKGLTTPTTIMDIVNRVKSWDNNNPESSNNSAVSVQNNSNLVDNSLPAMINADGSSNLSNVQTLDQLGPLVTEAVIGAIPELQRQWSSAEALKERNWQTEMSNTAYQRSVQDMIKAGINPILAYSQGGASSGSGASASGMISSGANVGSTLDGVTKLIRTVMKEDRKDDVQASQLVEKYSPSNSARTMHVKLRK